jgi:hypothetical protein
VIRHISSLIDGENIIVIDSLSTMHIVLFYINVREYRKGHANWIIQKNWQHMVHKTQEKHNKNTAHIYVGHHHAQTNTTDVDKT